MKILINEREIEILEKEILYTGNANSYLIDVEFTNDMYKDFLFYLTFKNNAIKKKVLLTPSNKAIIPFEVLENAGDLVIGFYATKDDGNVVRYSSNIEILTVNNGAYDENATYTEELTPTILDQYLQEMRDFYEQSKKQFEAEVTNSTNEFEANANEKIETVNRVAEEVNADKTKVENMKASVEQSEQNSKQSEINSKTSETKSKEYLEEVKNVSVEALENVNTAKTDAITEINSTADTKIEEYNNNSNEKLTSFNNNASQKVTDFDNNAVSKTNEYNQNLTSKLKEYNDNSATKMADYNANATSKLNQYNANSTAKTNAFNSNYEEKIQAINEANTSIEQERIESDKRYAKAIESDVITITENGQVNLDENGYMKEVSIESVLPEITQEQRKSRNLLEITAESGNFYGVNVTKNKDGSINLNGTPTQDVYFNLNSDSLVVIKLNVKYTSYLKGNTNDVTLTTREVMTSSIIPFTVIKAGNAVTEFPKNITNDISTFSFLTLKSRVTYKDVTVYPMIIEGECDIDSTFEPYGAFCPSMDYPSNFENVVENVNVENVGKNFLNVPQNYSFTREQLPINLKAGTYHITCGKVTKGGGKYPTIGFSGENYLSITDNMDAQITITEDKDKIYIYSNGWSWQNSTMISTVENLMISKDGGEYKPYIVGYSKPIPLQEDQFLGSFQGYKNSIEKGALKSNLKILTFTGDEKWYYNTVNKGFSVLINNVLSSKALCTHFICENSYSTWTGNGKFGFNSSGTLWIQTGDVFDSVEKFKEFLVEQNNLGTPVQILYISEEGNETLPEDSKSTLNSLQLYNGLNDITCNECLLKFKANKNLKKYVQNEIVENNKVEREISDNKYPRALKTKLEETNSATIYAENDDIEDLVIKGDEITQKTRSGKNKLKLTPLSATYRGVTITINDDGSITLNGTVTGETLYYNLNNYDGKRITLKSGTYTTYLKDDSGLVGLTTRKANINQSLLVLPAGAEIKTQTINLNEEVETITYIKVALGETLNNVTIYPMILEGTYTKDTPFEKYGVSPSLEFPSEIEVTKNVNVSNSSRNILNLYDHINVLADNITILGSNSYSVKYKESAVWSGLVILEYNNLMKNSDYVMSLDFSANAQPYIIVKGDGNTILEKYMWSKEVIFNTQNYNKIRITMYAIGTSGVANTTITLSDIMLQPGKTKSQFKKFGFNDAYPLTLPEGQFLGKLANAENYIYEDSKGDFYLHKEIDKVVIDDSNVNKIAVYDELYGVKVVLIVKESIGFRTEWDINISFMNNYMEITRTDQVSSGKYATDFVRNSFVIFDNNFTSLESAREQLKGTIICCIKAKPEDILITDSNLIETLKSIKLKDYENNVAVNGGKVSFIYNKSLVRALEEKDEKIDSLENRLTQIENLINTPSTSSVLVNNLVNDLESEVK